MKIAVNQILKAMKKEKKVMKKQKAPPSEIKDYVRLFKKVKRSKKLKIISIREVAANTSSCPLLTDLIRQQLNVLRGYLGCENKI